MVQENPWIDYDKIQEAIKIYKGYGYKRIKVPWFVSRRAMEVTAPPNCRYCTSFIGDLVASGEQSLIQMWMDGNLKAGKWQCETPCFRDEPIIDEQHLNYFFKVELIEVFPSNPEEALEKMIDAACDFFWGWIRAKVVETKIGKDIVSDSGIELGSYGYREYNDLKWVYGTGVAEPRLSYAEKIEKEIEHKKQYGW